MAQYDPHDPDSVDQEAGWLEGREAFLRDAWARLIRDGGFRLVLGDLLSITGYDAPTFVAGSFDQTAYLEGRRSIGLAILTTIRLQYPEFLTDIEKHALQRAIDGRSSSTSSTSSPGF
jgi:hypothetical protein